MANNNATTTRPVNGGNGDDVMTGDAAANVISGGSGHDTLSGAGGDDVLKGDAGRDLLDGGAGSDRVDGHSDDDVLVYVAAENVGAHDEYDGGAGVDTLRLVLTREEWMRPAVQSDVAGFLAFVSGQVNPSGQATAGTFAFTAFDLVAGKFERLEVTVDGVPLDPRDEAVTLADDASQTDEDGSAAGAVLANDAVPDLVRSVEVVVPPANGTLAFNPDGTYVYTPGASFNAMAAGETAIETFQYRVTDADFDSAIAMVTVTITGTNDGPVVTNTAQELVGAVQEDGPLTATGQLGASDVDHNATQTWTVEGTANGGYGSIAVDAAGRWVYTLDNAAHQDLAQGESHDETFTIRVTDDQGAFVDQVVTVNVAGTNDGPVITGGATSGSVTEDATTTQATGLLVADDPDHGAQEIWTVVGGTPSGSADYLFTMDRLTVTRNGQPYFEDEFSDGLAPPSGVGPFSYVGATLGALTESGGRLVFDGANAMPFIGVGTPDPIVGGSAVLRTNIDPASAGGLKSSADFTVAGVFDLVEPDSPRETYGIRLTDRLVGGPGTPPDQLGDNAIEVRVIERTNGTAVVAFRHLDFVSDTATLLQAIALAPPPGADQIRLHLAHSVANMGQVQASFEYLSGGVVVGTEAFSATGQIFQGENWTRAEVIASAPAMNDSTLGGTYGTLTVAQSGGWTYDIDNGRAATQALAQGQFATDTFTVQVADEFGAFDTRTITIQVAGTNDGPAIQTADVSRALGEDANVVAGQLTATGEGQFSDVDLTDTHTMSAVLATAQLSGGAPLPAGLAAALGGAVTTTLLDPATGDGHAQYRWDFALNNAATQFLAAGQTLQLTYDVVATDSHGASAAQQVAITITGANDAPVVAAGDVTAAVIEAVVPVGSLGDSGTLAFADADLADVHATSAVTPSAGALGALTAGVTADTTGSGVGGIVTWHYGVDAAAVEYLAAGQTRQESFTFDVADGQGGSVARTVTATITGTNDAPVIGAADTGGSVTALPDEPDAPPPPLVFTVQQFLNYQSNNLANLRSYVAAHAADYTVQTSVIDYTDDPGGFAGELPGSSPWPAAQAQNVSGTGGINNVFFARITADFSVATADTYTFRTFNDDGVFLLIDNQLILQDTGYHPEAPFTGSIALQPGDHTIELFFYENGGEASLEFSARSSTGQFGLVGASGGGFGGANVQVQDSGTLAFSDVDLTDAHLLSAAPVGTTLGALAVVKNSDTTGTGTGGQATWTYSVGNAALGFLAAGETRTESFLVTLDDQHGGVVTRQVDVTVTGTNDDPVVAAADVTGAVTEMIAPAGNLTDSGTIGFQDLDLTDVHSVGAVTTSAPTLGTLTAGVTADTTGSGTGGVVTWTYSVPASAVEYLGAGQSRVESFTFDVLDGHGGSVTRTVAVTITGTNDAPVAAGDVLSATEDTPVTFTAAQLLANDSDGDANAQLSIASVTSGAGGTAVLNADGSVTFTPHANFNGPAGFSYVASDGAAQSNAASVTVGVAAVNDPPAAVDDANALTVEALPSGAQSNFVNWVDWTSASPGSVVGTIDLGGGQTIGVTYSGEFGFAQTNGGDNFYTDYDNNGSPSTTTYTSAAVQNGPTGSDIIALSQASQKTLTFSQPVNDLFFAIVSLNGNGYLFDQDFDVMSYGQGFFGNGSATRVALPDGRFSVVGNGELHGVLRIDGAVQSLTWTSQTPEWWNGFTVGTYGKAQTATVAGNVLGNDSDADGDALAVSAVNGQQIVGNSVTLDLASGARVRVNKDGTYLYDEDGAFGSLGAGQTSVDSFQYTVSDGQGGTANATVHIAVTGVNDAATIGNPTVAAVTEDAGVDGAGNLVAAGTIPIADPDAGQAAFQPGVITAPGNLGSLVLAASGAYTYSVANALVQSLAAGQTRTDTFTVQAVEGTTKTVNFTLHGANDAPAIVAPQVSVASTNFDEVGSGEPFAVSLNGGVWRTNDASGVVEVNPGYVYGLSNNSNVIELERTTSGVSDLYTDVAAAAGQFFRLDFDYAARSGLNGASSAFDVYWNNAVVAQFSPSGQTMQHYELVLSAPAAGNYRLEFQGNDGDGDGGGALLDNIGLAKINAVVEMGAPAGSLSISGALAISDVDLTDGHSVSAAGLGPVLGTLTPLLMPDTTGSGTGTIQWTYSVAASALEYLAAGELRIDAFSVALDDGHGGVATQQVEITLVGTAG